MPVAQELAEIVAELKHRYKLGLADAIAASLTKQQNAVLITKDTDLKILDKVIKIIWI